MDDLPITEGEIDDNVVDHAAEEEPFTLPLAEFGDDLLLKIFGYILGPLEQGQYCVNNAAIPVGIKLRYEHLEPTHLQNFENIIVLSQTHMMMERFDKFAELSEFDERRSVNQRWRRLIEKSSELWHLVNVRPKKLKIGQDPRSWQRFFQWLAPKMSRVHTLYICEEEATRDSSCDQVKLGALSCLGHQLRALHLDRCFHPSVGGQLVSLLAGVGTLEQLQVTNVNHDFISKMSSLNRLDRLTKVQIQGCEDYWDHSGPMLVLNEVSLPQNIEVLSLSNIKIWAPADAAEFPKLTTLHLVFIEWYGNFVKCVTAIKTLKYLIVQDCDRAIDDEDNDESIQNVVKEEGRYWPEMRKLTNLEWLELNNAQYGDFTERLGKDLSAISWLTKLTRLRICPEDIASRSPSLIGNGLSMLTSLTQLHLMNFGFRVMPVEVLTLPLLQELSLAGNNLKDIPWEEPSFVSNMRRLYLDTNCFDEIPEALKLWTGLEELSLSRNVFQFSESLEFIPKLPRLRKLVLGPGRGIEVFPDGNPVLIESLCNEMRLSTVGIFHFGGLCETLKLKDLPLKIYM